MKNYSPVNILVVRTVRMYFRIERTLLLLGIDPVEGAGHNIEEVEVREMILSAPVGATISDLPMLRYGF